MLRRIVIASGFFLFTSQPGVAAQNAWTTEVLMETLAKVTEARLTFVEYRTSSFLVDKIKLTGHLTYVAPDFILKSVESPFVENIEIDGDTISIEKISNRGESSIQRYSLTASEVLNTTVEGIRATLAGNLDILSDNYNINLSGEMSDWIVLLVPKEQKVLEHIEKIAITGSNGQIKLIETFDADGDESSLNLSYLTVN